MPVAQHALDVGDRLSLENRTNNWHNEWAYWIEIKIVSE